MTWPSEKFVANFEIGDHVGDLPTMRAVVAAMESAETMQKNMMEAAGDTHAENLWLGAIPILYDVEVMGYIVFEDFGSTYYKAKEKEGKS